MHSGEREKVGVFGAKKSNEPKAFFDLTYQQYRK